MLRFFCFFLLIFSPFIASALENGVNENNEVEDVIIRKVKKNIIEAPQCNDEILIEKTKEFINSYYDNNKVDNVFDRRKKLFILKYINDFSEENIANYKSQDKRPVADVIANLLVNEKILEENIRLCKNNSKNKEANEVYLLVHSTLDENNFKVYVLNLLSRRIKDENLFFEYQR